MVLWTWEHLRKLCGIGVLKMGQNCYKRKANVASNNSFMWCYHVWKLPNACCTGRTCIYSVVLWVWWCQYPPPSSTYLMDWKSKGIIRQFRLLVAYYGLARGVDEILVQYHLIVECLTGSLRSKLHRLYQAYFTSHQLMNLQDEVSRLTSLQLCRHTSQHPD